MSRTTTAEVEAILGADYDPSRDLTVFMRIAYGVITKVIACAARKGVTYLDQDLIDMETALVAHFYTVSGRRFKKEKDGKAEGVYEDTSYASLALALDETGCLDSLLSKSKTVVAFWMGKRRSEQTDYVDRD